MNSVELDEKTGCQWIEQQQSWLIDQTLKLAAIQSGSDNLEGLAQMHQALVSLWQPLKANIKAIDLPKTRQLHFNGEWLEKPTALGFYASKRPNADVQILLTGHMDTVFPAHTRFKQCVYLNDKTVNGPGVSDMKGGLIVMLAALMAFERTVMANNIGWQVAINPDEETGSHASSQWLQSCAQKAHVGLVYEPALTQGELAGARKGSGNYTLKIIGKSAHAGRAFHEGVNAITSLANIIQELDQLNQQKRGLQVNVARVQGGEAFNIVPEKVTCQFNVRADETHTLAWFEKQLQDILSKAKKQSVLIELDGHIHRPAKPMTPATAQLFTWLQQASQPLGLYLSQKPTGGCCDGNNLAAVGLPTLDTLGVCGGKIHTEDEFISLASIQERAKLSFLFLCHLANNPQAVINNRQ